MNLDIAQMPCGEDHWGESVTCIAHITKASTRETHQIRPHSTRNAVVHRWMVAATATGDGRAGRCLCKRSVRH